jgi:transcriptional regulator with XRE-family HTH domain
MQMPNEIQAEDTTEYSVEELLEESASEASESYLLATWFYRAMESIRNARLRNGLTQSEVAERIGTTQSVVARMENAHRGSFSVHRFLEYAWGCGAAPLELEFVPPQELRRFAIERPGQDRSTNVLTAWRLSEMLNERSQPPELFKRLGETTSNWWRSLLTNPLADPGQGISPGVMRPVFGKAADFERNQRLQRHPGSAPTTAPIAQSEAHAKPVTRSRLVA